MIIIIVVVKIDVLEKYEIRFELLYAVDISFHFCDCGLRSNVGKYYDRMKLILNEVSAR